MVSVNEKDNCNVVANLVRVELDDDNDTMYLVFHVTNEKLKNKIKKDWMQDIDLKLIDKNLYEVNDE